MAELVIELFLWHSITTKMSSQFTQALAFLCLETETKETNTSPIC